jgi:hypothetical protein
MIYFERDKYDTCRWYNDGVLHRENGPAVIYPDRTYEWWINGVMQENKPEIFNENTIKRLLIEREEMLEVLYRIKDSNVFLGAIAKEMMDQVLEKAETLSTSLEQRGDE